MCFEYQIYFDTDNLSQVNSFLRENSLKMIYTDHFTKYSIDIIRSYEANNSKRISGKEFNFNKVNQGEWILYNKKHIDELELQKFKFPDFSILKSNQFKKVAAFNDFIFYEKVQ